MEKEKCYGCRYYKPYYTKGYFKFDRVDLGLCGKSKTTVDKHFGCNDFAALYNFRIDRKAAALTALTENINMLAEIKQILEECDYEIIDEFAANLKKELKK